MEKRKIVGILFSIAILLLILNIVIKKPVQANEKTTGKDLNSEEIKAKFFDAMKSVGLENDWIIVKRNYGEDRKWLPNYYYVEIPIDLPIPIVIREVQNEFDGSNLNLDCKEEKLNGKTTIDFVTGRELRQKAVLTYDADVRRNAGSIGLMVLVPGDIGKNEFESLLDIPEYFTSILVPSKNATLLKKEIKKRDKNYAVLLNDDITPMDYSLKSSYPDFRIRNAITAIVADFSDADFFMIDNNSDIFSSPKYRVISREFKRRNIKLVEENSFVNLRLDAESKMETDFDNVVKKTTGGKSVEIILTVDGLQSLLSDISKFRKIGFKFVNPGSLILK